MATRNPTRLDEIRSDVARGKWGIAFKLGCKPNAGYKRECRIWFGKSVDDFVYSSWMDQDPDRMEQLINRANYVEELLTEIDRLQASCEAISEDRLSRHLANQKKIDARDETIDILVRQLDDAKRRLG